ncbi:MAG: hypothetical protein ACRDC4_10575, partial [Plesiomonas sp.]
ADLRRATASDLISRMPKIEHIGGNPLDFYMSPPRLGSKFHLHSSSDTMPSGKTFCKRENRRKSCRKRQADQQDKGCCNEAG